MKASIFFIWLIALISFQSNTHATDQIALNKVWDPAGYEDKSNTYAYLITSNDLEIVRVGAKSIFKDSNIAPILLDLSLVKMSSIKKFKSELAVDTFSWLTKAVGKHGNKNHVPFLKYFLSLPYIHEKSKEYLSEALERLAHLGSSSEIPVGEHSEKLSLLHDELAEFAKKNAKAIDFLNVTEGMTIEAVYKANGLPYFATVSQNFMPRRMFRRAYYYTDMAVFYPKQGVVIFTRDSQTWVVKKYFKAKMIEQSWIDSEYLELRVAALFSNPVYILKNWKRFYKALLFDMALMDILFERSYKEDIYEEDYELELALNTIKIIGDKKYAKYNAAMKKRLMSETDEDIIKYLNYSLKKLKGIDSMPKQYQLGDLHKEGYKTVINELPTDPIEKIRYLPETGYMDVLKEEILNGDLAVKREVARLIYKRKLMNESLLDVVKEQVSQLQAAEDGLAVDTASWMCRALGQSKNSKYQQILERTSQQANHEKLREYASRALKQLMSNR